MASRGRSSRRWRLVGGRRPPRPMCERRLACVAATASGVCQPSARAASAAAFLGARCTNRCVLHRAQRPSNASHRWRRICARAAYGQQMDLHPEIFASSVARRAFQATPVHMRYRNASMRLCSDAELQRIEIRALASTMCVFCRYRGQPDEGVRGLRFAARNLQPPYKSSLQPTTYGLLNRQLVPYSPRLLH